MWPERDFATSAQERYERYGRLCAGNRIDYSLQVGRRRGLDFAGFMI
jgi:hypothetical protein